MNQKLDWNYERYRTRDRLIEYDGIIDALYPKEGIALPYPQGKYDSELVIPINPKEE